MVLRAASFPHLVFPRSGAFWLENQTRSGGISILGNEQITVAPSSRWRARFSMPVVTEASVLAWRAFVAGMGGRAGTVLVPKWEAYGPRDINGRRFEELATAQWGDQLFDDGGAFDLSGFGQDDTPVYATLASPAALNATQIAVNYAPGIDGLRPGQYFTIGQRIYMVTQTWQANEGDPTQIRFSPWLREGWAAGTPVIIDRPVCLMRFAQDQTGELDLDMGRWSSGQLELVEAL